LDMSRRSWDQTKNKYVSCDDTTHGILLIICAVRGFWWPLTLLSAFVCLGASEPAHAPPRMVVRPRQADGAHAAPRCAQVEAFLEQSLSANIPWPSELARDTAHTCQAEQCCTSSNPAGPASHDAPAGDTPAPGKLTIEESIRKDARKVKLHARKHPALLSCSNCGGTCTPRDQFSTALSAHSHAAGLPPEVPTTNEEVAALKWRGVPHGDDPVSALRRCIILANSQSHKPSHHPTCLKSQKAKQSGLCRGKLPAVACPACVVEFILGCPDHPDAVDLKDQPKAESEDRKAFISDMIDVILQTQDPAALRCTLRAPSGSPAAAAGPEGTSSRAAPEAFAFCPHVAVSRVHDIASKSSYSRRPSSELDASAQQDAGNRQRSSKQNVPGVRQA